MEILQVNTVEETGNESRETSKMKQHCCSLCRVLSDRVQSFVLYSQIVTELINMTFLLVANFQNDNNAKVICARSSSKKLTTTYNKDL